MSEVKFGKTITLKQAASLIRSNPETRFLLRGEPGIGKSSLLENPSPGSLALTMRISTCPT